MADLSKSSEKGMINIKSNPYPGRGIIIGQTPDGSYAVQIYWIMGRSENSRNRIFIKDSENFVKTHPYDPSKVKDPSLIIYYPVKHYQDYHIVTNGDQTDTVFEELQKNGSFEIAVSKRDFEPDGPNYTPRISAVTDIKCRDYSYRMSIIKTINNDPLHAVRYFFNYKNFIKGTGHCITTYAEDGDPLPSYEGEPFLCVIFNGIDENISKYWEILNKDNIVSLLVKYINIKTGDIKISIKNKYSA